MTTTPDQFTPCFTGANGGARCLYDVRRHVRDRRDHAELGTVAWLMGTLRSGRYTSVGSYPKYWLTSDGAVLSHAAVRANIGRIARAVRAPTAYPGWRVVACDVNWEDPAMYCDDTGERIESAYAEPEFDGCNPGCACAICDMCERG